MNYIAQAICLLTLISSLTICQSSLFDNDDQKKCEPISVPMCQNIEYNQTSMPNQFNHESQEEAAMEAHQFWALVEINCAIELKFFLCSLYTPICLPNYNAPIRACKSVCTRARLGCEKYMKKFGFEWPEHMNCDLFPEYGSSKEVCMDPMDAHKQNQKTLQINNDLKPKKHLINEKEKINKKAMVIINKDSKKMKNLHKIKSSVAFSCPSPFINVPRNDLHFKQLTTGGIENCIQPCDSIYFDRLQKDFAHYWLLFWSMICLFSSICTTCTYLIDPSRFKYPEKPIVFLSICYLFVSIGYIMRFFVGHDQMACQKNGAIRYDLTDMYLNNTPSSSFPCILSFIFIYYFGMASSIWWIVVSLTWFLAAGLKWGTEAIARYRMYFHLAAWLLPFFQTTVILALSLVDADPLSGICSVGNLSTYNLRIFVILPAVCYLLVGITFLFAGFVALFRIRKLIREQHNGDMSKTHKLEKLMLRIGVFSILYTVPATCVIACQFYEQYYREDWERNSICKKLLVSNIIKDECVNYNENNNSLNEAPIFSVFILKYLMGLIIGVTSGFWIWTSKTLRTWQLFLNRICFCFCVDNEGINETESTLNNNQSSSKITCFEKMFRSSRHGHKKNHKKNSIIYFQANDDLENNPHNNFYEESSDGENSPLKHEIIMENCPTTSNNSSGVEMSYKNPESVVSLQFNSTGNTMSSGIPFYNNSQIQIIENSNNNPIYQIGESRFSGINSEFYSEYANKKQIDTNHYSAYVARN